MMKVVCISNNVSSLREWDRDWDRDYYIGRLDNLTVGKLYDAENIEDDSNPFMYPPYGDKSHKGGIPDTIDIFIRNDTGVMDWLPYYLFEPLVDARNRKLKGLGI